MYFDNSFLNITHWRSKPVLFRNNNCFYFPSRCSNIRRYVELTCNRKRNVGHPWKTSVFSGIPRYETLLGYQIKTITKMTCEDETAEFTAILGKPSCTGLHGNVCSSRLTPRVKFFKSQVDSKSQVLQDWNSKLKGVENRNWLLTDSKSKSARARMSSNKIEVNARR